MTALYTPQQNGMFERCHRQLVETGLTLLTDAHMPLSYWPYVFQVATYLINRMPTSTLKNQSLFEKLFKKTSKLSQTQAIWLSMLSINRPYNKHKLEPKVTPYIFVGYSLSQNTYLCLDPKTRKLFHSRHVIFHEGTFLFQTSSSTTSMLISPSSSIKDSFVQISLPHIPLPSPHPIESLELGVAASPSFANGSSPSSLPR
jgi:histone deacetylase 1/2